MNISRQAKDLHPLNIMNIFREAKQLLETKVQSEMTEEELTTVKAALIPLTILPCFNDVTTSQGLEALARLIEEHPNGRVRHADKRH